MKRIDPTFKPQTQFSEETEDFLNELFDNLFDNDDLTENTDRIPDLSILDR
jgi:hypothetical protein